MWQGKHVPEHGGVLRKETLVYTEFDVAGEQDNVSVGVPELLISLSGAFWGS